MPINSPACKRKAVRHVHPKRPIFKRFYVAALLLLLPLLMTLFSAASKKVRNESDYLGEGFTLKLAVEGWERAKTLQRTHGGWHSAPHKTPQLTIGFRDLDYAFDVFIGNITLQNALAARYFTTHGPNDKGVAVTYLFTVILKCFFGWRKSYRS